MKTFYVGIKGVVRDKARGFLLLKREYKSGDFWDSPGGRIEGNDDFETTLRRELAEELPGISDVKIGELLGAHRVPKDIDGEVSLVLLYFLVEAVLPAEIELSDEHSGHIWINTAGDIPEGLNPAIMGILDKFLAQPLQKSI
ncbi:MAG TPA: NUDIX hydrolase [Candidatus Saccharimonadales bacterium]|nr:NUDIX hydrolase [Candidatus Saccharimonadales bacterium]